MNIYLKLQKCKSILHSKDLKKSGQNKFSNYSYFELEDFIPETVQLFNSEGLCSFVTYEENKAVLKVFNSEKPEENIIITCDLKEVELKGANAMQSYGAIQTYARRYLYVSLLDIVENDILNQTTHEKTDNKKNNFSLDKFTSILKDLSKNNGNFDLKDFATFAGFESGNKNRDTRIAELYENQDKLKELISSFVSVKNDDPYSN